MINTKLLITTGLLVLSVPILDKGMERVSTANFNKHQEVLASKTSNQISQSIKATFAQSKPDSESRQAQIDQQTTRQAGFCLNIPILMYHHIQPQNIAQEKEQTALTVDLEVFETQMRYLVENGYQTISLEQLAQFLIAHQSQPSKSIVITIDDGYQDIFSYAFPILQKYNLKANLMIPTGLLNNPDYITWDQLGQMIRSNLIFVANHTWSHANLTSASSEKINFEVQTAQKQFAERLGSSPKIFAYPYGQISQAIINYLSTNGFLAAVSTIQGKTQCQSSIFSLGRIRIGNSPLKSYGI